MSICDVTHNILDIERIHSIDMVKQLNSAEWVRGVESREYIQNEIKKIENKNLYTSYTTFS